MKTILNQFIKAGILLLLAALGGRLSAHAVERWGIFEVTLRCPAPVRPSLDPQVSATFSQGGCRVTVPGFWDGGDMFKIRFSPPSTGEWNYETHSALRELNGQTGSFTATETAGNNHGPVVVFDTFYLRYADGTPYHQFGTTCYAWAHQTPELQEQTLQTLAASPFNKIRFCLFPKSYAYNTNEPDRFAFQKDAGGKFDFSRPDPVFWRHFEQRLLDLQRLGLEADLILWHPYDRWGFADLSDEEDDRYLRYCIARLSAFRNVWWSLANEYDFMTNVPKGHRGNKQWEDWDRFFSILQKEDPHQRLRGIHNGSRWYDHTKAWVTHASLQTSDMEGGVRFRAQYGKPVVYDECKYEGDIPQGWGNLTAREMTQRFWLGTLSGCYVGHGETYKHPRDILWWSKGGVLHGQSPQRIQWLKDLMAQAPAFHELQPLGDGKGSFVLAKEGEYYLVYCLNQRPQRVRLAGARAYKLDLIDPWEMTVTPVGTASPGESTVSAPKPDLVYRFTPYQPGEKLRPEARIEASVTEGVPPLKVAFASAAGGRARWDFGDGATSLETSPSHVFQKTGLYMVKLTVTDAEGNSAQGFQSIAVDRDVTEPILSIGLPAEQETRKVIFHGTARRASHGSFHLPDGAPWGWVQVGNGVLEDLRGLRSFTVMGWLKPESLQTGSGGNRILFCLKESRSGIDLVCHSDGRLRLAINEWPDSIRNDSSPGKLQVGQWTGFAVSYDATASGNNVSWYFSAPSDTPRPSAVTLDRKTAYHAGPVDNEVGPLVIGNFNETMRGYGLDRQFRGEIRNLRMFGSRVSGRGALSADEINSRLLGAKPNSTRSLKEAATGFAIGLGLSDRIPQRPMDWPLLLSQFSCVTPENCLKPDPVQRAEGQFRFGQADAFVDFATSNHLQVVGHCLVWAKDDRTPVWFYQDGSNAASAELLISRMKTHIDTVVGRYRGRIAMWDVVNEALDDGTNYLRDSGWSRACGEEFIIKAFEFAQAADPEALLIYNDYNNELPGKRAKLIRLVRSLREKKVPVHAIGLQGHYEIDRLPLADIETTLIAMRELGVKVVVSELDIDVIPRGRWWQDGGKYRDELSKLNPYAEGCPPEVLRRQAEQYGQLFRLFRKYSDVIARVSFWNLHDGQSWLNDFPWKRVNHPLLFDRAGQPKPAFDAVLAALQSERGPEQPKAQQAPSE